jgi:hypothetical protein
MLPDLITSYWSQTLPNSELVIFDDASQDSTGEVVSRAARKDKRITYRRNPRNVGYCENLKRAILESSGQYIVILGDDDLLLGPHGLNAYVEVFDGNPDVHYAYPNQIQVDVNLQFDLAYRHFVKDAYFAPGLASYGSTWLKSIFISGIGLRRSQLIELCYPTSTMLFPQVELVGRLVSKHASFGIGSFLIAARAHADQLGFYANRRQRILGPERHGTIEVLDIAERLNRLELVGPNVLLTGRALADSLSTNLPNEKLKGNTRIALSSALGLMRVSRSARRSPKLLGGLAMTVMTPGRLLGWLRRVTKSIVRRGYGDEAYWYATEFARQQTIKRQLWN